MKTISRIMIILLAATLIGGVTYALGNRSWGTAQAAFGERAGERFTREAGAAGTGEMAGQPGHIDQRGMRPERREGGHGGFDRDGGHGFSFFSMLGLARAIVPIALIIGAVLLASNGLGRFFNRRKGESAPVAATAGPVDVTPAAVAPTDVTPTDVTPTDVTVADVTPTDVTPTDVTVADVGAADVAAPEAMPVDVVSADVITTDSTPSAVVPTDVTSTAIMTTDSAPVDSVPPETPPTDDQSTRA